MHYRLFLLCFLCFSFTTNLSAQLNKKIKLYTYYQSILPGIQKQVMMDDTGNAYQPENQSNTNYLIFLAHWPSKSINPFQVWIDGKGYKIKINKVDATPIELIDNSIPDQPKIIILVPSTNKTVLSISLNGLLEDQSKSIQFSEPGNQYIYVIYTKRSKILHTIKTMIIPLPSIPMM